MEEQTPVEEVEKPPVEEMDEILNSELKLSLQTNAALAGLLVPALYFSGIVRLIFSLPFLLVFVLLFAFAFQFFASVYFLTYRHTSVLLNSVLRYASNILAHALSESLYHF